ncbi:PAS domain-containing protein [Rossellomorea vietnamensis]|nr:ATP-binding protein [Rossellomorea vietnamensis]
MTKLFDFSQFNDNSTDAKVVLISGNIVYANQAFVCLLGHQDTEGVIGSSVFAFFHSPFKKQELAHLLKAGNGELLSSTQHQLVRSDNRLVDVEVMSAPFLHNGEVFVQAAIRDLSTFKNNGRINIQLSKDNQNVYIYIRDNGSGISKEDLYKIGKPFFTSKENGNGLGLMVSFNIIKNHNGTILIDSEEGLGTTFTIILPLASEQAPLIHLKGGLVFGTLFSQGYFRYCGCIKKQGISTPSGAQSLPKHLKNGSGR